MQLLMELLKNYAWYTYITRDCFIENLFLLQKLNTKIIYSAYTSSYLLELTTCDKRQIYASVPQNYNAPKLKERGTFIRESSNVYDIGII